MLPCAQAATRKHIWLLVAGIVLLQLGSARAVRASPTSCEKPGGGMAPCRPGNDLCHRAGYSEAPQFHVVDYSCGMNDPAAVVYDPVHAVYHDHWEDHLAQPGGQHAVSRDLIHWARMPVSMWNDRPYDNYAIFTGSATVVDGSVVQVYPGLCNHPAKGTSCPAPTSLCLAVPSNVSDPLQTNWTKDGQEGSLTGFVNPVVNDTGRDPSTAWKTPAGEWQLTTFGSLVMGSRDFKRWYKIGVQSSFPSGECPSFFPLPGGAEPGGPTHVYKYSAGGRDWMLVGDYKPPQSPKTLGNFTPTAPPALIDAGVLYASKDFYDPVKQRRINWGWAKVAFGPWGGANPWGSSCHTLPREVTWDSGLQQLVFAPLAEQMALRGAILGQLSAQELSPMEPVVLVVHNCSQSDVVVAFDRPAVAANLSISLVASTAAATAVLQVTIHYQPPISLQQRAEDTGSFSEVPVESTRPSNVSEVDVTVTGAAATKLRLSPSDKMIEVRLFADNVISEIYLMGGRVALTVPSKLSRACGVTVGSDALGVVLNSAAAWAVTSIWTSPEQVLDAARPDGGAVELMKSRIDAQQQA